MNSTALNNRKLAWICFIVYLLLSGFTVANHEMWGDEVHSWNIAKGSDSYADLIHNSRFEGHPPVWYSILWTISQFTHDISYVQAVHWGIAALSVMLILFFFSNAYLWKVADSLRLLFSF